MSLRRAVGSIRELSSTSRVSAYAGYAETSRGDPGPNAAKFRKSQKKALRSEKSIKVVGGLDALNGLLNPVPPPPRERAREYDTLSGDRSGGRSRFDNARGDRPGRSSRSDNPREDRFGRSQRFDSPRDDRFGRVARRFEPPTRTASPPDAYGTSLKLRKITKPRIGVMSPADLDKAIKLVMDAPKSTVSTPVWNMLLGTIGREGRLELMWKTFNDMKKRGFKPTTRTFTTLINAYAGLKHADDTMDRRAPRTPEPRTVSRVSLIFDQAQSHLATQVAELERLENQNDPEELGLKTAGMVDEAFVEGDGVDINIGPVNAYLKFLAKYGMMREMEKVFTAMPTSGPLSPDSITFSTMFSGLYDKLCKKSDPKEIKDGQEPVNKGLTASSLWNQAYRQFRDAESSRSSDKRKIDEELALIALKSLSRSDYKSQQQTMQIIDALWPLPRPSDKRTPTQIRLAPPTHSIPHLPLTIRAATTIMAVCPKPTDRSHYAHLFLLRPELQKHIDTPFLITAIRAFSGTGDSPAVLEILQSYQPRKPNHWPPAVWHDSLTAARWSVSVEQGMKTLPNFENALKIMRMMAHLPPGVEDGEITGPYIAATPNGKPVDTLGVKWIKSEPVEVEAKPMSIFLKTALSRGYSEIQQAVNVFNHLDGTKLLDLDGARRVADKSADALEMKGRQWGVDLCRDVERACERLLEREMPEEEKAKVEKLLGMVKRPERQRGKGGSPSRFQRSSRQY